MKLKDQKEASGSSRKPDISHARTPLKVYTARGCEYGDRTQGGKYERSNFLRPAGEEPVGTPERTRAEFLRHRVYMRALVSHASQVLDSMELHQATDPQLEDVEGMRRAVFAEDTDSAPGCTVGPSRLPHACGAAASLNMAITQAVTYGLLPADPGQPWRMASLVAAAEERYRKLIDHRVAQGSFDFYGEETEVRCGESGLPVEVCSEDCSACGYEVPF